MIVNVYLPLILPLLATPAIRWAGNRLPPATASWLVIVFSVVLAACSTLALGLLLFTALDSAALRRFAAVHLPVDIAAGVLLVALLGNGIRVVLHRARDLAQAHLAAAQTRLDDELLVLPDRTPLAYALPGRPGRIVVSAGMLAELAPAERRALLAHERTHLARAHHLLVAAVDILAAVNPLLRPLSSVIRYATERWADESAAQVVGDRRTVATAVGKAALATRAAAVRNAMIMSGTAGPVPRRVGALLSGRRLRGRVLVVSGLCATIACCLVVTSVASSWDAVTDLQEILRLAQRG